MVAPAEGRTAVDLARETIASRVVGPAPKDPAAPFRTRSLPPVFDELRGVFVTLRRFPSGELRGCIGFPEPTHPLRVGIPRAAWSAAVDDPRFPPLDPDEVSTVTVEVSILTMPRLLSVRDPAERPKAVRVGVDGLIVQGFGTSGLLLPQVAREERWSPAEFLNFACRKAGLPDTAWRDSGVDVLRFQAEVFAEERPPGAAGGPGPVG